MPIEITPGQPLLNLIGDGHVSGRPIWTLGTMPGVAGSWEPFELMVPRLELVPQGPSLISPVEYANGWDWARTTLGDDLHAALVTGHHLLLGRILETNPKGREHTRLRAMTAAILHDIAGWPYMGDERSIESYLGSAATDGRYAKTAVKKGRAHWQHLAAWPWWGYAIDGGMLGWHEDVAVHSRLDAWLDPASWLASQRRVRSEAA